MKTLHNSDVPGEQKRPKLLTGYHVLAMILAFFGVIISVNFTMAWLASSSWTGLVVKNSYVASQEYNEKLNAARVQKERGWRMSFDYRDASFKVSMRKKNNDPLILQKLEMKIGRPAFQTVDRTVVLTHTGNGQYETPIDLEPGIWGFELNSDSDKPYHIEGRFIVSDNGIGVRQ